MHKRGTRPQFYDERVVFHKDDLPWIRDKIQEGQGFIIKKKEEYLGVKKIHYKVLEKFTYHASCVNEYGQRKSFNYFDLYKRLYGVT